MRRSIGHGKLVWKRWVLRSAGAEIWRGPSRPAGLLSCYHRYFVIKSMNASWLTFSLFWWNAAFRRWRGPRREPRAGGGERQLSEWWPLAGLSVPWAQRASNCLAAVLLMSCRARDAMSHILWGFFWYAVITLMDLPSMQIKMEFPLTSECRSQKEVKVFMFVFSLGYYFGFPLLPVLI